MAVSVAEAGQRLEQFKLDLDARKSDVITSECQLRFILGLPPADGRVIIPLTPACEAKVEPVWNTCLHEMLEQSPEIVTGKAEVRELRDAIAIAAANVAIDPVKAHPGPQGRNITKDDQEHHQRISQKEAELEQTIKRQIESLARVPLHGSEPLTVPDGETIAACRHRPATGPARYYDEGRITADRFLDAVSQQATATGSEALYLANYNTSIVGLAEVKGTLLADYGIEVAERPKPRQAVAAQQSKTDAAAKPAAFVAEPGSGPAPPPPPAAISVPPMPGLGMGSCESKNAASTAAARSWTFSFTIGSGPNAVQIKGTIAAADHATPTP